MRGEDEKQDAVFSYVSPEERYLEIILCGRSASWSIRS